MPANRNALIRYKTIDRCLQNRFRKWTLEDLIEACSEALYEYEGITRGVSKRTVQGDIQMMRSDKLGYNAPIIVRDKRFYTYADPGYSITNIPLTEQDLARLGETVDFLKQFKDFSHFHDMDAMVQKLEDHVASRRENRAPVVLIEQNAFLKGLEHLDMLYRAITREVVLRITYQSFTAQGPRTFLFHPWVLKEFNNRWFLIGVKGKGKSIQNLALDRMNRIEFTDAHYYKSPAFDAEAYFKHVVGVTVRKPFTKTENVVLFLSAQNAPYVLTKPIHPSQEVLSEYPFGITISLDVQVNIEFEKEILALGDGVLVVQPLSLRRRILGKLLSAVAMYDSDFHPKVLQGRRTQFKMHGYTTTDHVYSYSDTARIIRLFNTALQQGGTGDFCTVLCAHKKLRTLILSRSLAQLVSLLYPGAVLVGCKMVSKDTWGQGGRICLRQKTPIKGFTEWEEHPTYWSVKPPEEIAQHIVNLYVYLNAPATGVSGMQVVQGSSQGSRIPPGKVAEIVRTSDPGTLLVRRGSVVLCHNLLLRRPVIHDHPEALQILRLDLFRGNLPEDLVWACKIPVPDLRGSQKFPEGD